MSSVGKIKFKKENDKPKLMDSIIFVLIIILCIVTVVTIQLRSEQKREKETSNMQRVENTSESTSVSANDVDDIIQSERDETREQDNMSDLVEAAGLQAAAVLGNKSNDVPEADTTPDTEETGVAEKTLEFSLPVNGKVIKRFSTSELIYSKTLDDWRMHLGTDIYAPVGTEVFACEAGCVEEIYDDEEFGATVTVRHNERLVTRYSNLALSHVVSVGDTVAKGQKIGVVGDTAMYEILDEPHLHFSMSDNGGIINPDKYIKLDYGE